MAKRTHRKNTQSGPGNNQEKRKVRMEKHREIRQKKKYGGNVV